MAPQRSASAPLPPILLVPRKIGGALRPLTFCQKCIPSSQSPPLPPLAPVRPRPYASSGASSAGRLVAPPHSRWGLKYQINTLPPYPNPHPAPHSLRSLPPPTPGGGLYYFCYTSQNHYTVSSPITTPKRPTFDSDFATVCRAEGLRLGRRTLNRSAWASADIKKVLRE